MSDPASIDPARLVYHRGRVLYGRLVGVDGPDVFRHAEDVLNGEACGCVCSCGAPLIARANDPSRLYERVPHFAHKAETKCELTGQRGLVEAFRIALVGMQCLLVPAVLYRPEGERGPEVVFREIDNLAVTSAVAVPAYVGGRLDCDLMVTTPTLVFRLVVTTKRTFDHSLVTTARAAATSLLVIRIRPNQEHKLYMRDVLTALVTPRNAHWAHRVDAAAAVRAARTSLRHSSEQPVSADPVVPPAPSAAIDPLTARPRPTIVCWKCRGPRDFRINPNDSRWGHCETCGQYQPVRSILHES